MIGVGFGVQVWAVVVVCRYSGQTHWPLACFEGPSMHTG